MLKLLVSGALGYFIYKKYSSSRNEGSSSEPEPASESSGGESSHVFKFASGLPDCCTSNPEHYKVVAEIPGARLVEMELKPGEADKEHEHPEHSMYVVQGAKMKLTPPPGATEGSAEVELPTGAAPVIPAGKHVVENVGTTTAKIVFVEPYPTCKMCGTVAGYRSPFDVAPTCYAKLAENDEWVTGMLTMKPGEQDPVHHHRDHLIYFLEGDQVTIYPGGDESAAMDVPLHCPMGVPAPMSAPPFAYHSLKNTGTKAIKAVFFEMKN
ncbi:hypothetical protein NFJ02_45g112560 [Pycnococcus provasolii]